jgi:hypothetical protein
MLSNVLSNASSPYLLQHAHNPVHWQEWDPGLLKYAGEHNKPLIISIGYAACHWCHVMEHESFMDSQVADLMNQNYVCIKVDREERPDIDQIYMTALQLMSGRGGWPLNVFALPDGRPFYAGTYFSKEQWKQLLLQISQLYTNEYGRLASQAEVISEGIRSSEIITLVNSDSAILDERGFKEMVENYYSSIDFERGGYKGAPKFPLPAGWEFLLQYYYLRKDQRALLSVVKTLDEMAMGGIYDQIGGGFARYSVDDVWKVPHFEKMLYDNGQLVSLYSHAYKINHAVLYKRIIQETLGFILREMTSSEGGFYASLNADSEGREGKFYVWTRQDIRNLLTEEEAKLITEYFEISHEGNWEEGNNILHTCITDQEFARRHNLEEIEWTDLLITAKEKLLHARSKRIRPSSDDKILTGWNAIMIKGFVDAFFALGENAYLTAAVSNARFLERYMMKEDGTLFRNYRSGKASIDAFLEDYAQLSDALVHLYQATFDIHWLDLARNLTDYVLENFSDPGNPLFFYTSEHSDALIARNRELSDNVIPASNSVMANVLLALGEFYNHREYTQRSKAMLRQVQESMVQGGPYYANWGLLAGKIITGQLEVAIVGDNVLDIAREMQRTYQPTSLYLGGEAEHLPLMQKKKVTGKTLIYVCRNHTCQMPLENPILALQQISRLID